MTLIRTGLIYFNQAIKDGSIRKAADRLKVASSAVNRQLLLLEKELDVELFERLPRGIRPTAAGESLLAYVRDWGHDVKKLRQEINRLKGGVRGTIHIAAAESISTEILPRVMTRLQESYPLVNFSLISGDNYFVKSALLAKDADLVCAFDISGTNRTDTVTSFKSPIGVVVPAGHPLQNSDEVSLADCMAYPVVAPSQSWLAHSVLGDILDNPDFPFQIIARVERIGMLRNLVIAGLGIGFLSPIGLSQDIHDRKLSWIPLTKSANKSTTISLLVPKGRVLDDYTHAFVQLLKDELDAQAALIV